MIDVHLTWCGPCIVLDNNYRALYFAFEEPEKRLEFFTIEHSQLPPEFRDKVQVTCKPRFLIYLEGEIKADIEGVDYNKIETVVTTYIPGLDEWMGHTSNTPYSY